MGKGRRRREAERDEVRSNAIYPGLSDGPHDRGQVREATKLALLRTVGSLQRGPVAWREWPVSEVYALLPVLFGDNPTAGEQKFAEEAYKHAGAFPDGWLVVAECQIAAPPGHALAEGL